jgi:DNA processing protein
MNNLEYYLGFSYFLGIGPQRLSLLLQNFSDVKNAYLAKKDDLVKVLGEKLTEKFIQFRSQFDPKKELKKLKEKEITVLSQEDEKYPQSLKKIADPPICLYVKGDLSNFDFEKDFFLAIVGTRKPTSYGETLAKKFTSHLASMGIIVVSGMALGIDSLAHWAALNSLGKTIAVLGCGVDVVYPPSNRGLYQEILKKGGLIISEFPPGRTVLKGLFVARNRIISGLSLGVLVIEGAKDSGALITARYAAEQGKEVFAPPSPLTSPMSEAPNFLLKQGAKLVTDFSDILAEFNLKISPKKKKDLTKDLSDNERLIFESLSVLPKTIDDLILETKIPVDKILNFLSILEIKGVVEKNKEGKYQITSNG